MTDTSENKIKAVLAADIAGFSRLMERDQAGTLTRLRSIMADLITPGVHARGGEVVKGTGDGFLAAFDSVVSAVDCAVRLQREIAQQEADQTLALTYRMAVHIGEVVLEGGDIFGDGVNVASRLEALAPAGGLVVSGTAQDLLKGNLPVRYRFVGAKPLKNIAKPVRVFVVVADGIASDQRPRRRFRRPRVVLGLLAVLAAAWLILPRLAGGPLPPAMPANANTASLAVLPLANLSGDPAQDYFVSGLARDIATDLSQLPDLIVVPPGQTAPGTTPQASAPRQTAQTLGVRYLLTGSVQRQDQSLRITLTLLEGATGQQLWAERYDGTPQDVLAFQDAVVAQVMEALPFQLDFAAVQTATRGGTETPQAFDAYLRASDQLSQGSAQAHARAAELLEQAVTLDPAYGRAQALLADVFFKAWSRGWTEAFGLLPQEGETLRRSSLQHLERAMEDPTALAHLVAARHHQQQGRYRRMFSAAEAALELDRNDPEALYVLAWSLALVGSKSGALDVIDRALSLTPTPTAEALTLRGAVLFLMARDEEAEIALARARDTAPESRDALLFHIAALQTLGKDIDSELALARARGPQGFAADWRFSRRADQRRLRGALTAAGLPDRFYPAP